MKCEAMRDHLFISYAWEDLPFAEWLTNKLTGLGYKVWRDQVKMFGGESFPREIDDAIRNQSHRMLGIVSPASLNKSNPMRERTLALNLGQERKIGFLIPLNRGVSPSEINWMISDLTYIDFRLNWAEGFDQLLKALVKAGTPQPLQDGLTQVVSWTIPHELTRNDPEVVHSSLFPICHIPDSLFRVVFSDASVLTREYFKRWASYRINENTQLAFEPPPGIAPDVVKIQKIANWRVASDVEGIRTSNILKNLIYRSLRAHCMARGMVTGKDDRWLHIPRGLIKNNHLKFEGLRGKITFVTVAGERSYFRPGVGSEKFNYHLAPEFRVYEQEPLGWVVQGAVRIYPTTISGEAFEKNSAQSRRKATTRDWHNQEWGNRMLGMFQFLANKQSHIVIGADPANALVIAAHPLQFELSPSLNDEEIERRRAERRKLIPKIGSKEAGKND